MMRGPDPLGQAGKTADPAREELFRCQVCDSYLRKNEGYTCPRCKRGPICKTHRARGKKECTSCVFEMQMEELRDLRGQEQSIKSFLKLLQFLFLVFAIVFIALKTDVAETVEFLKYSIITNSLELLGAYPLPDIYCFISSCIIKDRKSGNWNRG